MRKIQERVERRSGFDRRRNLGVRSERRSYSVDRRA